MSALTQLLEVSQFCVQQKGSALRIFIIFFRRGMRILYSELINNYSTIQIGTKYYWSSSNDLYSAFVDSSDSLYVILVQEDLKAS
jgi:hypothetical protein